jgi:hypothetical protein
MWHFLLILVSGPENIRDRNSEAFTSLFSDDLADYRAKKSAQNAISLPVSDFMAIVGIWRSCHARQLTIQQS